MKPLDRKEKMNEVTIQLEAPELKVIESSKAEKIKSTFQPMVEMLTEFEENYTKVIQDAEKEITEEVVVKAKRLRLDIGKVRIETEKLKKSEKEEYLRAGKAIDGVANILKWAVIDKENKLKEIENHFEVLERKRIEDLQKDRAEKLSLYIEDAHERKLSDMDDDVWSAYFNAKKQEHEDRLKAEKKAEEERKAKEKAEAEERERIKKENETLKKEAEAKEKKAEEEKAKRAKAEAERLAKEEAERQAREKAERKQKEEYEAKIKAEREKREQIEREEKAKREKLEAELKAKEEAERQAEEEEKARIQKELNKGDSDKISDLIQDLETVQNKYSFQSEKNKKMCLDINGMIEKIIKHIQNQQLTN